MQRWTALSCFFQQTVENMWTKSVLSRCTVYRIAFGKITITTSRLAHFAAEAVGADMCPKIETDSNGIYNKTVLLTMDNNSQFVAKRRKR
jgi:hypothetical protein